MQKELLKGLKIDLNEVKAELCRRSFYEFVKEFWDVIIPEKPIYNWHIKYLCDHLQEQAQLIKERKAKKYDTVINIPPGTTKSTICTVMFPAWCWAIDPTFRIITGSYSSSLSTDHAVKSRDIVKDEKYQLYFPYVKLKKDQDNKTQYKTTKGGERYATSVGGTITGIHAHLIIIDDPVNPKQAMSDVERTTANEWMDVTLSTRKVDKEMTPTILVMQRLHELDPSGNWLNKRKDQIHHICLPGRLSEDVKPKEVAENYVNGYLDPVRLSDKALNELQSILGAYGYAGQIQQRPSPEGGGLIKSEWFGIVKPSELPFNPDFVKTDFFIDGAFTDKVQNDETAMLAVKYYNGNAYIMNAHGVRKELNEFMPYFESYLRLQGYNMRSAINIEMKASGYSFYSLMRNKYNCVKISNKVVAEGKIARVKGSQATLASGRIFLVNNGNWIDKFLNQCNEFPNGAHDDLVDVLAYMVLNLFVNEVDNGVYYDD